MKKKARKKSAAKKPAKKAAKKPARKTKNRRPVKKTVKKVAKKKATRKPAKKAAKKKATKKPAKKAVKKPARKTKNRRSVKKAAKKKAAKKPARKPKNRRTPQGQVTLGSVARRAGALTRYRIQDNSGSVKFVSSKCQLVMSGSALVMLPASRISGDKVNFPGESKTLKGAKVGRLLSVEYRWEGKSYVHEFKDSISLVRVATGVLAASGVRHTKQSGFLN